MMQTETFVRRIRIEASAEEVFRWHAAPGALRRLTPPWEPVEVEREGRIEDGDETVLRLRVGPFAVRWVARISDCLPGRRFRDTQVRGPFAFWQHTHRMEPEVDGASWLEDNVEYALPLGRIGGWLGGWVVRRRLERMFAYRHRITAEAFSSTFTVPRSY
jgi:ligand-binding SRPBCC domain-containing protein